MVRTGSYTPALGGLKPQVNIICPALRTLKSLGWQMRHLDSWPLPAGKHFSRRYFQRSIDSINPLAAIPSEIRKGACAGVCADENALMKKAISILLVIIFGVALAVVFPIPKHSSPGAVLSDAIPRTQKPQQERAPTEYAPSQRGQGWVEPEKATWWRCDPLDQESIFGRVRENVQTFGEEMPAALGYKNCTRNLPDANGDTRRTYRLK